MFYLKIHLSFKRIFIYQIAESISSYFIPAYLKYFGTNLVLILLGF